MRSLRGQLEEESMRKLTDHSESASSREPNDWHTIDWQRVEKSVRTTQQRIAKATREEDWRRVKTLQRSLTHSFSARALAVRLQGLPHKSQTTFQPWCIAQRWITECISTDLIQSTPSTPALRCPIEQGMRTAKLQTVIDAACCSGP